MDSPASQPLTEEEACAYAEWVHRHTGYQTMVARVAGTNDYYITAVDTDGGRYRLNWRADVARFVNAEEQQEIASWVADLEEVKGLQAEIARLRTELADCTRDCRKAGERFERVLDLLTELDYVEQRAPSGFWKRLRDFLDSE